MVSYINQLRGEGQTKEAAVINGCRMRLRPVLMTALVALLGLLPMAFAQGVGAEVQRPLATVVISGLFGSTFLTLIVLQVAYIWFGDSEETRAGFPCRSIGGRPPCHGEWSNLKSVTEGRG